MLRRPPRGTRTDTLFPYSTLFRSFSADFPIILTSGRLVEYEGGDDETRSNPWLAELQQHMFVEINPVDANHNGVSDGEMVWVHSPDGSKVKVMARVTERVGRRVAIKRKSVVQGQSVYVRGDTGGS